MADMQLKTWVFQLASFSTFACCTLIVWQLAVLWSRTSNLHQRWWQQWPWATFMATLAVASFVQAFSQVPDRTAPRFLILALSVSSALLVLAFSSAIVGLSKLESPSIVQALRDEQRLLEKRLMDEGLGTGEMKGLASDVRGFVRRAIEALEHDERKGSEKDVGGTD